MDYEFTRLPDYGLLRLPFFKKHALNLCIGIKMPLKKYLYCFIIYNNEK